MPVVMSGGDQRAIQVRPYRNRKRQTGIIDYDGLQLGRLAAARTQAHLIYRPVLP